MKEGRICDSCGYHNTLGSLFCENPACGEDISHLPPTNLEEAEVDQGPADQEQAEESEKAGEAPAPQSQGQTIRMTGIRLVNTASGFEVQVPLEGGTIGRSGTIQPEHFQNSQFVSNEHARIQLGANGYLIVDLGSTNGTKVNGVKIASAQEYPIPPGTRITVANLDYEVQ